MFLRRLIVAAGLVVAFAALAPVSAEGGPDRRVNAPHFAGTVRFGEAAVFWFGAVGTARNYADARVAYTDQELWISLEIFDQWLWEDDGPSRAPESLETWDAATLVLDTGAGASALPATSSYRFVGQLSWWRPRTDYQAAYRGSGTGWTLAPGLPFTTETGWRGDAPNTSGTTGADRGWAITFRIPFSTLGLSAAPPNSTVWRLAVAVHDKDAADRPATTDTFWPETFSRDQPATWGQLAFGLRPGASTAPPASANTLTIRHRLNGAVVTDAMVGGGAVCGGGLTDYFAEWGSANYAGDTTLVTQNQSDVADWPCFSKAYFTFPLGSLPAGKSIVSATLTVHQFGGSDPSQAERSLVQVLTVAGAWDEGTITWNTAPLAVENVSQAWVDPIPPPGLPWPGAARTFDVTWAVSQAYAGGQPDLRLALYQADAAYHSGKYFTSSETGDWNAAGRPALTVTFTDGSATPPTAPANLRIIKN